MYLKVIETSQTWTCPKTGTYLITCVGGGGGGGGGSNSNPITGANGGITSFGTYLATTVGERPSQGTGFTITNGVIMGLVGASREKLTSLGYGFAGAGDQNVIEWGLSGVGGTGSQTSRSGIAGAIVTETIDLTAGDEIVCTVGTGGTGGTAGGDGVIVIRSV